VWEKGVGGRNVLIWLVSNKKIAKNFDNKKIVSSFGNEIIVK
jgi:hypothetical protein